MKGIALAMLLAAVAAGSPAANAGISISVGQPGFYGRIDIGDFPPPVLLYPEPVVIERVPASVVRQPIYLHVPPGHAKDWRKHCRHYGACGRPVYFVQENWYNDVYVPAHRERHGRGGRDAQRPDKYKEKHGHPHDNGRGHGHGRKD